MRVLITYPIGLLLKAYLLCALVLVKVKEVKSRKPAARLALAKKPVVQTA